jgi:hypothetical protein
MSFQNATPTHKNCHKLMVNWRFRETRDNFFRNWIVLDPSKPVPIIILPYLGEAPLDVLLFFGTALYYRIYQWRRGILSKRLSIQGPKDDSTTNEEDKKSDENRKNLPVHKATTYQPYKDPGLYDFMEQCKESRRKLRKVPDPNITRQEKLKNIKVRQQSQSQGALGLSPVKLAMERKRLTPVSRTLSQGANNSIQS